MPRDLAQAASRFQCSEGHGSVLGMRILAAAFVSGEGLPAKPALAATWAAMASALSDIDSNYLLATPDAAEYTGLRDFAK